MAFWMHLIISARPMKFQEVSRNWMFICMQRKMIDTRPKDALVFEDIPYGILAGKRAGMEVCAVKDPYSQGSVKEKKEIADYYINTYYDILDGTYEILKK